MLDCHLDGRVAPNQHKMSLTAHTPHACTYTRVKCHIRIPRFALYINLLDAATLAITGGSHGAISHIRSVEEGAEGAQAQAHNRIAPHRTRRLRATKKEKQNLHSFITPPVICLAIAEI